MSFDALVYARARQDVRSAQSPEWKSCPSITFLGYTYKAKDVEDKSWNYFIGKLNELREDTKCSTYVKEWNTHAKAEQFSGLDTILGKTDDNTDGKTGDNTDEKTHGKTDETHESTDQQTDHNTGETTAPEIPLLMWRNRVKNFITLGSPIDKYHVMWWQKYLHMGLKRDGFIPPARWEDGVKDWLDDPLPKKEERIRHYNFCDEQDPVGHHLDVARGTVNYKKIFDADSGAQRDIVFRRYAKPGVAHVQYWKDKELFKGILEEVIDNKDGKTCYFLDPDFREGEKAFDQALLWAYFRVPFFAALVTAVLVIYALYGGILIYRIAAGLGRFYCGFSRT